MNNTSQQKTYEGDIRLNTRGTGFMTIDEETNVRIEESDLHTALHGDRVSISLLPKRGKDDDLRGEVVDVLVRNKREYVGTLKKEKGVWFCAPQDMRMYRDIAIPESDLSGGKEGQKVFVRMHEWNNAKQNPEGAVLKVIGWPGDNDTEMEAIVLDKGFQTTFPPHVEEEAQRIKDRAEDIFKQEVAQRRDMRDATTLTIDPASAKDFDDALSFRVLENGHIEIGIYIADVSQYVEKGSEIDKEAERRGTSIYLVDRTIPMLPEVLSNDLCSINPNEDKLAYSIIFTLAPQALEKGGEIKITDQWIGPVVINSDQRFAYEDAQKVLDDGHGPFFEELSSLNHVAKQLRKNRWEDGAISFDTEEIAFELDENGKPVGVRVKEMQDTNHLIEEFMLLANRRVAKYAYEYAENTSGLTPFVYRIHDKPNQEKLEDLVQFLHGLGYDIEMKNGELTSHQINNILKQASDTAEEHLVQTAAIRSMAKAVYAVENIGHFGLAFEYYTHFTSPIRRYPDLMVHRLLKKFTNGQTISKEDAKEYRTLSLYTSQMEQIATEAERASIKLKQVEYMAERVGDVFEGVISGVTDFGIFVEASEAKAEGMIHVSQLGEDFFTYDKEKFRLVGERTKKTYQLGDKITVQVASVDVQKRQINFGIPAQT